jgi:hypothetical protein
MKTRNKIAAIKMAIMLCIVATLISCSDGGGNSSPPPPPPPEQPQKQPDTTKALSFGTNCKVTIKSDDLFLTAEWTTLCDKVVAAFGRGYNAAPNDAAKNSVATFFSNNSISIVLLKSAAYDCEVKGNDHRTMYLKANASVIDSISGINMLSAIGTMMNADDGSYPSP